MRFHRARFLTAFAPSEAEIRVKTSRAERGRSPPGWRAAVANQTSANKSARRTSDWTTSAFSFGRNPVAVTSVTWTVFRTPKARSPTIVFAESQSKNELALKRQSLHREPRRGRIQTCGMSSRRESAPICRSERTGTESRSSGRRLGRIPRERRRSGWPTRRGRRSRSRSFPRHPTEAA